MATDQNALARGAAQPADPHKFLALAVVAQAINDARGGDPGALYWLANDAPTWLDFCGVDYDPGAWARWIRAGLPRGGVGWHRMATDGRK